MKIGSEAHKELFCQSFMASHLEYEPERLPWPQLDETSLGRLRSIPFWKQALMTEQQAGIMVSAFAATVSDPMIQAAIALQGREETRHARLIEFLINRYDIKISDPPPFEVPKNVQQAFIDFGFEECLDSFFAFGLFELAHQARYLPEPLFDIFEPLLDEEARHIVFFVNWVTYLQINQGRGASMIRGAHALWHYSRVIRHLIKTFGGAGDGSDENFTAAGASTIVDDLTPEMFLSTCLQENARRMSVFDQRLLQPQLLPAFSKVALRSLKLLPRRQVDAGSAISTPKPQHR